MKQNSFLHFLLMVTLTCLCTYSCKKSVRKSVSNNIVVTDVDGNKYQTVTIGDQIWIAAPLRVTHYKDTTLIPYVKDGRTWATTTIGARCYYGTNTLNGDISISDSAKYVDTFGGLYNWAAVHSGKLAPEGFHVPDTNEVKILINFLGGADKAGQLLKSAKLWNNDGGSIASSRNKTGLSIVPAGSRDSDGKFGNDLHSSGYFWTSSATFDPNSILYYLNNVDASITQVKNMRSIGLSVFCIKDK